jgi:hypothetical protein
MRKCVFPETSLMPDWDQSVFVAAFSLIGENGRFLRIVGMRGWGWAFRVQGLGVKPRNC